MKNLLLVALLSCLSVFVVPAFAQTESSNTVSGPTMPYERGFWRSVGVDFGQARHYPFCFGLSECNRKTETAKFFVGGQFNKIFGLEAGYVDVDRVNLHNGGTEARGVNFTAIATVPVLPRTNVVGKFGAIFGWTNVSGTNPPTLVTGMRTGWNGSAGLGIHYTLTPAWTLRADFDRYRFRFSDGDHSTVDAVTAGVQWNFM